MFDRGDLRAACRLYAVTDGAWLEGRALALCVSQAVAGGATFVQLRDKKATTEELARQARDIIPICHAAGVPFVVNDDVEAALAARADGVHVGQGDVACDRARAVLGESAVVGVSVQTVEQAVAAERAGADYLGVGALFGTSTKPDAALVSKDELRAICAAVSVPVVAIGGLNVSTIPSLRGSGIAGAAVVSALFASKDIERSARDLSDAIGAILAR